MKLRGCRKISSLKINGAIQDIAYFDCSVPPIFMLELECVQNQLNKDMLCLNVIKPTSKYFNKWTSFAFRIHLSCNMKQDLFYH